MQYKHVILRYIMLCYVMLCYTALNETWYDGKMTEAGLFINIYIKECIYIYKINVNSVNMTLIPQYNYLKKYGNAKHICHLYIKGGGHMLHSITYIH